MKVAVVVFLMMLVGGCGSASLRRAASETGCAATPPDRFPELLVSHYNLDGFKHIDNLPAIHVSGYGWNGSGLCVRPVCSLSMSNNVGAGIAPDDSTYPPHHRFYFKGWAVFYGSHPRGESEDVTCSDSP